MSRALGCDRVERLLSEYLDERLAPARAQVVDDHLARCGSCRGELAALRRLVRATSELPRYAPAEGLADRVRDGVEQARDATPAGVGWGRVAAAAVVIGVGLYGSYRLGIEHGRADSEPSGTGGLVRVYEGDDHERPEPQYEPLLPEDDTAVRAAQSLFADLELIDSVPPPLREHLLRSQIRYFDLDRWAEERAADRPEEAEPVAEVARLVRELDDALEDGLPEEGELHRLRERAARPGVWIGSVPAPPAAPAVHADQLVEEMAGDLHQDTRRSLRDWIEAKDSWVRGGDDLGELQGLLRSLDGKMHLLRATTGPAFTLPDLDELKSQIRWTEEPDGTRSGKLEIELEVPGGKSELSIEVHSGTFRSVRRRP